MAIGDNRDVTYFAETDFRNKRVPFGVKSEDRSRHVYVIGKTGMGKSTLLENMAVQDIKGGNGLGFIDPHGKTAELFLDYIPKDRIKDVVYFAPHDLDYPIAFNVMEDVGKDQRHLVANGLMAAFKKIWPDVWSARMEYISTNIILALLEYPDSTLLGVNRMLSDKAYRKKVVDHITDPVVKSFWVDEFAKYSDKLMVEAGASIQNKFGQFVSNPLIRNIVGQPKSTFNLRDIMDGKKILIMNLSKGRMGEINANLIGGMLITKIYLAAMSRANLQEHEIKKLPPFYFFVDEFQSFVNDSFKDILSEARKYKLALTIAHQYIEQVPEEVRNAVFGNVGTTIAFRVGPFDAEVLEKVFAPKFTAEDLVNLGFAQIYLTLMIDGVGSPPFSAKTLGPISRPEVSLKEEVVEHSRKTYARPRVEVEEEIRKWHESLSESDNKGVYTGDKGPISRPFPPQGFSGRSDGGRPFPPRSGPIQSRDDGGQPPRYPKPGPFQQRQFSQGVPQNQGYTNYTRPSVPNVSSPTPQRDFSQQATGKFERQQQSTEKNYGQDLNEEKPQMRLSLSDLTKGGQNDSLKHKSTGKNVADLKTAIMQAMKNSRTPLSTEVAPPSQKISQPEVLPSQGAVSPSEIKQTEGSLPLTAQPQRKEDTNKLSTEPKAVKEVSEEVLKKILEVPETKSSSE